MINFDTSRCYGSQCLEKKSCLRYLAIESDKLITEPCRISYTDNMCEMFGMFVYNYKIELENK